jgi:hypothetical protein
MKVQLIKGEIRLAFTLAPFGDGPQYPSLTGKYRPMTPEERTEFLDEIANCGKDSKRRVRLAAEMLARRVIAWDLEESPSDSANIAALPPAFFDGLQNLVVGYSMSEQESQDEKKSNSLPF